MGIREFATQSRFGLFWLRFGGKQEDEQGVRIEDGRVIQGDSALCAADERVPDEGESLLAMSEETHDPDEVFPAVQGDHSGPEEERHVTAENGSTDVITHPGRPVSLERFWTRLEVSGRSKRTIEEYRYEAAWWQKQAAKCGCSMYTLTAGDIDACVKDLHPATLRRKVAFLRTLSRFYARFGHHKLYVEAMKIESPRLPERIPGDRGAKNFLELRTLARDLCDQGDRVGIWIGLQLMAGCRISEIQTAQVAAGAKAIKVIGKGNKERLVPTSTWVLDAMTTIQREGNGGWAKKRGTIWKGLRAVAVERPHSLRHTFASELLRRKKSLEQIRVLLGHVKIDTTTIYAQTQVEADVAEVLDA